MENLRQDIVSNAQEAVQILKEASKNRTVAATSMNSESSRSHSVFTLYIQSKVLFINKNENVDIMIGTSQWNYEHEIF